MNGLFDVGLITLAGVILIIGTIAVLRCPPEDIAEVVRALSRFVGHPDSQPGPPIRRAGRQRSIGPGTGPPPRDDSRSPRRNGPTALRPRLRRAKR